MGTTLRRTVSICYKTLTEKGLVKKHAEHLRSKKETIKDEIYPEVQLKNGTYIKMKLPLIPLLQQIVITEY